MSFRSGKQRHFVRFPLVIAVIVSIVLVVATVFLPDSEIAQPLGFPRTVSAGTFSQPRGQNTESADADLPTARLSFFRTPWPKVLQQLAAATNSELVMQKKPTGRFSRRDHRRYSRTEAVGILNRDLEPLGFRLLEQGQYLVVLPLESLRTRYRRPALSQASRGDSASHRRMDRSHALATADSRRQVSSVQGRATIPRQDRLRKDRSRQPGEVRTAAYAAETPLDSSTRHQSELVVVDTPHRGARNVAQVIYRALKRQAELIDAGPKQLPAFRVYRTPPTSKTRSTATSRRDVRRSPKADLFSVGLDIANNALVIDGPKQQQRSIAKLIRLIDSAPTTAGHDIRLVPTSRDATDVARSLSPILRSMAAQKTAGIDSSSRSQSPASDRNRSGNTTSGSNGQPASTPPSSVPPRPQPPGQPRKAPHPPAGTKKPATAAKKPLLKLEGLHGRVTIQDVPGIGMVVTGNQHDVETVVRIIQQLENLATGAMPNIHLLKLRNVNSETLASLLNDVYDQLTSIQSIGSGGQPRAAVIPVVKPNAILVIASSGDMKAILDLTDQLDQPVNPRTEFAVFALRHAIASQVVTTLETLYGQNQQQQQPVGLRGRIRAVADSRTNSLIVQATPADLAEVTLLIRKIDRDSSSSVSRMRVFPLKNAVATDLAEVINSSIQNVLLPASGTGQTGGQQAVGAGAGGQSSQQLRDVKSVVLEFLTTQGKNRRTIRSGILADIRVTADPRVNSLIVTAPEQSMPLMAELIRQLDLPTSNVAEIKVFALVNGDATSMQQLLETLFSSPDQQNSQNQLGIQVAGAGDASSGLIPLRFSVDVRTNSIIAIGGAEALRVVEAVLLRLDESDIRQRKNTVIKLKNSPASDVAAAINQFLQSQRDLAQIDPDLLSNVELLEKEVIVVPEAVSNSLLISATPRYYEDILDLIEKLDKSPEQVIIQVLIVEVDLQNTDEFGVELGFQDSSLFDRGLLNLDNFRTIMQTVSNPGTGVQTTTEQIVNQETVPGFLFNNAQLGNNTAVNPAAVGTQGLSNFSLGRVNGDLGFGGLVLSASSESVNVLIRALAAQRKVHILSRPQIRTVDNQLASIQVGQQVPVISGATTNNTGGITPVLGTPQQVGIILQVTPRITPEGIIVMETIANKSAISGQGVPLITDPGTGAVVESPIFDLTEARSTVAVPDGQTIVLGGMITQSKDQLERKVPWLGDIPLLGAAFRFDSTTTRRTELLIFMTPRIIKNNEDSELIKQVEAERLHYFQEEAEEIHGPLFAVPMEAPEHDDHLPPSPAATQAVPTTIMPAKPLPYTTLPGRSSLGGSSPAELPRLPAAESDQHSDIDLIPPETPSPLPATAPKQRTGWLSRFRLHRK